MLLPPLPGHLPIAITPDTVEIYPKKKRGLRGCSPWVALPSGGERGSFSKLYQRINECRKKEDFNRA
jgi:hypothetical protein